MVVDLILEGQQPLLVHSQRAMNYRDDLARELQNLNSRRNKTLDDRNRIQDLEMELGLYYDYDNPELGPYFPALNIKRCIQDGGKQLKLGTLVQQALRTMPGADKPPILYPGPRDMKSLVDDPNFRDVRTVVISGRTVERCRPIFRQWKIGVSFMLDEERLDLHRLKDCIIKASKYIGLGDFRPEYGLFTASVSEGILDASNTTDRLAATV